MTSLSLRKSLPSALFATLLLAGCTDPDAPPTEPPPEPPPPSGTEITFDVVAPVENVAFVAYQDGDGAWQAMQGASGTYKAHISSGRFGVAVGCKPHKPLPSSQLSSQITVIHSTTTEGKSVSDSSCGAFSAPTTRTVTGTITGIAAGEQARAQLHTSEEATPGADGAFSVAAPRTKLQSFAVAWTGAGSARVPTKIVRGPEVDVGGSSVTLDLAQAVAPVSFPVTFPAGTGPVFVTSSVRNNDELYVRMYGSATEYRTVPAAMLRAGDLIRVVATENLPVAVDGDRYVIAIKHLAAPGPMAMSLGAPLVSAAPTFAQRGGQRLPTFSFSSSNDVLTHTVYSTRASTKTATLDTDLYVTMSPAWIGGARAVSYPFPDFSHLPGWSAELALASGPIEWVYSRDEQSTKAFVDGRTSITRGHTGTLP